jgi:hypothetical protein
VDVAKPQHRVCLLGHLALLALEMGWITWQCRYRLHRVWGRDCLGLHLDGHRSCGARNHGQGMQVFLQLTLALSMLLPTDRM